MTRGKVNYNNRGVALYKKGQYMEAIQCYDEALKTKPNNAVVKFNRSVALDKVCDAEGGDCDSEEC